MFRPTFYLSSPSGHSQMSLCAGQPVLISYGMVGDASNTSSLYSYIPTWAALLIDSGAFSVMNSGKMIDVAEYRDWATKFLDDADAVAGLDDIEGDWRKSLKNYEAFPQSFPTFHDTDPPELLDDLVAMAKERNTWIGIGLAPPRHSKQKFLRETLERIPQEIHVHGWALCAYAGLREFRWRRSNSFDSTSWMRRVADITTASITRHLTWSEAMEIVIKRYQRLGRSL